MTAPSERGQVNAEDLARSAPLSVPRDLVVYNRDTEKLAPDDDFWDVLENRAPSQMSLSYKTHNSKPACHRSGDTMEKPYPRRGAGRGERASRR